MHSETRSRVADGRESVKVQRIGEARRSSHVVTAICPSSSGTDRMGLTAAANRLSACRAAICVSRRLLFEDPARPLQHIVLRMPESIKRAADQSHEPRS